MTQYLTGSVAGIAMTLLAVPAVAEKFTLRIGAGHPSGPSAYVTDTERFLSPKSRAGLPLKPSMRSSLSKAMAGRSPVSPRR